MNDVVDPATMSRGALNVLSRDEDGFPLMIEVGAIDWAGHANGITRDIEEVRSFDDAVDAVVARVEENSSWNEILLIVTAGHGTGYLSGVDGGEIHQYHSGGHTNMVVPFYFRGAGSGDTLDSVTGTDPVRGDCIDNTTVVNLTTRQVVGP